MSNLPEIIGLFARLASEIETLDPKYRNEDQSVDLLVSSLNKSLNLSEQSGVRVLDTALSLMCFTASQVFDSVIDYSAKTIVSVLLSSIGCKLLRFGKAETLLIGGMISTHDCVGVMEACVDVLGKLVEHGGSKRGVVCRSLLYAVVRVAMMSTRFRRTSQLTPVLDVQSTDSRNLVLAFSKLVCYFPEGYHLQSKELPLRLLGWYLDPRILMQDVSQVLQDAVRRPLLCLNRELYEKMEWKSIVLCLTLSPFMFIETRALLHSWFLITGLASVSELQVELSLAVLDVVSRPMSWGLSAEVGSKLPFSHTYFPYKPQLIRTFSRPSLSCGSFLELVHGIKKSVSQMNRSPHSSVNLDVVRTSMVDQNSIWAMAMNFPDWFYFATGLLFSEKSFGGTFTSGADENDQSPASDYYAVAAWYIAWILEPVKESDRDTLAECLKKSSRSLIAEGSSFDKHKKTAVAYKSKLKKPKLKNQEDDKSLEYTCQTIRLWLEEFQDMCISYHGKSVGTWKPHEVKTSQGIGIQHNVMFRKVTLGVLIGSTSIYEDGCELLLHYAATGTILPSTENRHAGLKHKRWNCDVKADYIEWMDECSRKEAVAGACIAFHVTDIAERVSYSIFETQEIAVDFICLVKSRVVKYLLKCVKRLLQFEIDQDDGLLVLMDLRKRMLQWRCQGKEVFQGSKELDHAIEVITGKISFSSPR